MLYNLTTTIIPKKNNFNLRHVELPQFPFPPYFKKTFTCCIWLLSFFSVFECRIDPYFFDFYIMRFFSFFLEESLSSSQRMTHSGFINCHVFTVTDLSYGYCWYMCLRASSLEEEYYLFDFGSVTTSTRTDRKLLLDWIGQLTFMSP